MLITVEHLGGDRVAPKPRPWTPPVRSVPNTVPMRLWVVTAVLTVVSSLVAMSRIGLIPFYLGIGFGAPKAAEVVAPLPPQLPLGKGMWIWQPQKSDGGDAAAIVARAKSVGLSHIYVRTGSSWDGFYAAPFLDHLLSVAHAARIRVYGWDFPRLIDTTADVERGLAAVNYETPDHQKLDGFAADIETASEGTQITAEAATAYGQGLRAGVGTGYPLIATVPRPSAWTKATYPYTEVVASFDAVAPMVYWLNRQPDTDVAGAISDLAPLGKPVFPVGQAFDGGPEGGRPGLPSPAELQSFMQVALDQGAQGVSFWSWQAADQQTWDTIRDAPEFKQSTTPPTLAKPATPIAVNASVSSAKKAQPTVLQAG